jgi:hypothetical protein
VSTCFALLALIAYFLVAAHVVRHVPHPSTDDATKQCAVCAVGQSQLLLPVLVIAVGLFFVPWTLEFASWHAPATRLLERALFARAPPSVVLATAIG